MLINFVSLQNIVTAISPEYLNYLTTNVTLVTLLVRSLGNDLCLHFTESGS